MTAHTAPQQIEARIAASRAELGAIIDAIERKLVPTPRQLLHKSIDMIRDRAAGDGGSRRNAPDNYAGALVLVGLGVGWLLLARGAEARTRPQPDDGADPAPVAIKPEPAEAADPSDGGGGGGALANHPLVLGALAFLAGAGASLLLPRATMERARHVAERASDTATSLLKEAIGNGGDA